ncbi:MAG: hypothetical protein H6709_00655 [Kofleriaceae bacterium]|nr:hypothetical protein [Kofleriaceae bacterium]MCB9570577.1 hypothetical protein [Kofleriaceae bacterium]
MRHRLLLPLLAASLVTACPSPRPPATPAPAPADPDAPPPPADPDAPPADPGGVPRFERTNIGASGLSAYLPRGFPAFAVTPSEDGSDVLTAELDVGGFTFGVIAVRFKDPIGDDGDANEELLIAYLDFLKGSVGVTGAVGYGRGHTLADAPAARGVLDYWQTGDGGELVVKGWVTSTHLAVLYITGHGEYPYFNAQQMFLDGIRFAPVP